MEAYGESGDPGVKLSQRKDMGLQKTHRPAPIICGWVVPWYVVLGLLLALCLHQVQLIEGEDGGGTTWEGTEQHSKDMVHHGGMVSNETLVEPDRDDDEGPSEQQASDMEWYFRESAKNLQLGQDIDEVESAKNPGQGQDMQEDIYESDTNDFSNDANAKETTTVESLPSTQIQKRTLFDEDTTKQKCIDQPCDIGEDNPHKGSKGLITKITLSVLGLGTLVIGILTLGIWKCRSRQPMPREEEGLALQDSIKELD